MNQETWPTIVLDFWFKELTQKDWFISSKALDEKITERFSSLHTQVSSEDDLPPNADGRSALAAIIVLDQFSRNMFRGTPQAFAYDALALHYTKQAMERQLERHLTRAEKQFLYMPFMHSENLQDHEIGLPLFTELELEEHALEHMELIKRFGRFPHRNTVLGRESTEAEIAHLESGKRYGQ